MYIQGMLSKSKGQVLRVAAVMHVLFYMDSPDTIPERMLWKPLIVSWTSVYSMLHTLVEEVIFKVLLMIFDKVCLQQYYSPSSTIKRVAARLNKTNLLLRTASSQENPSTSVHL